jgi:restriction system protein
MAQDWQQYQEEAAGFFRSLGLTASTNVTLQGVRTTHDIDVSVTIDVAGFQVRRLVECKHWRSSVNKLHVLALREIVADLGADRGIILCEEGFQSGAVEAANLTNVQVTSLAALAVSSKDAVYAARLRELYDRTELSRERYWDIPKEVRIEKGLRFGLGDADTYSGARVVEFSRDILAQAFRGNYPIQVDPFERTLNRKLPESLNNPEDVVALLEPILAELEAKLDAV